MNTPIIAIALSISEIIPFTKRWTTHNSYKNSLKMVEVAKVITQKEDAIEILQILKNEKTLEYQNAILKHFDELESNSKSEALYENDTQLAMLNNYRKNTRADIMVISVATGLCLCLGALIMYKNSLPGEAVGIISTIAGIFGSCLKDAFGFEFGSSRGSKEKDELVTAALLNNNTNNNNKNL